MLALEKPSYMYIEFPKRNIVQFYKISEKYCAYNSHVYKIYTG